MKHRKAMLDRFDRIRALYEEAAGQDTDGGAPEWRQDAEYESLHAVKQLLDARPRRKPDVRTIERIMAAARDDSVETDLHPAHELAPQDRGRRRDRQPIARRRSVKLHVGAASAVLIILLMVGGVLNLDLFDAVAPPHPSGEVTAPATAENADDSDRIAGGQDEAFGENVFRGGSEPQVSRREPGYPSHLPDTPGEYLASERELALEPSRSDGPQPTITDQPDASQGYQLVDLDEDILAWDRRGEMIDVFQNIERIHGGVERGWEPPAIPLEMMPRSESEYPTHILPAGRRQGR